MRRAVVRSVLGLSCLLLLAAVPTRAETVWVPSDRDTTLIEDPDGALSNGAGPALYVGRTNQGVGSIRRGLLRFDMTGAVPERAIIESVALHVVVLPGNPGSSQVRLYRVLADWGEGASFSTGGRGAPSAAGDATWIHTFYDDHYWDYAGGQFVGTASGSFVISGPGPYVVTDVPKMLADVRMWNANPAHNFGWILIGDETSPQTAQPIATREIPEQEYAPVLEITFRVAGSQQPKP